MEDPLSSHDREKIITEFKVELVFADILKQEVLEDDALAIGSGTVEEIRQSACRENEKDRPESAIEIKIEEELPDPLMCEAVEGEEVTPGIVFVTPGEIVPGTVGTSVSHTVPVKSVVNPEFADEYSEFNDNDPVRLSSVAKFEVFDESDNDGEERENSNIDDFSQIQETDLPETCEKKFKCELCDSRFSEKKRLNRHMRIHTGEKPHKCSICDKQFAWKNILTSHMSSHTGEKHWQCTICDVKLARKTNLTRHMRIHTGEKPHQCSICDKEFVQKTNLNKHMKTHVGKKQYTCSICNVKSVLKWDFERHFRKHIAEENPELEVLHFG